MKRLVLAACSLLLAGNLLAAENPHVLLNTSMGEIEIELEAEKAPVSVKNFLEYVESGYYDGTVFHRVIPGFMIQGGGFNEGLSQKKTRAPIKNEADNGLHNVRGTLAMARTQNVDSATSQFFINHRDNDFLDHGTRDFGYAVFAKVVRGMDVVDQIAQVPTGNRSMMQNVPLTPVKIISAKKL
ncbi:MAG: peptidylprolyl isomerase A [Pseudomonas sp.]|jgi:peptidyl-prolyl cis-trans isomerase A (cyclophilin A)|uniref:peptidylprolyl isomerase n=1 Tax=Stutzerimonas xanthomarina TaxID=271420 RepID=UPI000C607C64|nr:peptidylprolyl isomerase [Stutzerimonas xanthomarina]MAX90609.1 peptidylprolyl isomerase A [Pseudomonas sp.]MBU0811753.1 peptidylprolyl isomerase [Gammaproteobacteria bacterium]MBK3846889.1 peptidylprolyl isomerase A [Stutzerimonas xanthomarina]MBU0853902.1 peptidylprolyl isomerase [Gammaproteobacteria bacterium]MBU1302812.1 peptidylprolyl isomerase [Gammaproteobacteria bacterium]|tara:strand:+ start:29512 stop:30063 length:552 start_codon:yes stop_codon:yes gene_type:complete